MCKLGDIIVVNNYIGEDGKKIGKHSFIVINDKGGYIEGFKYDLVTNVISSFKTEEQKLKKLSFEENLEIMSNMIISNRFKNDKDDFIKANQLIYFDKSKIDYYVFGRINDDLMSSLLFLLISLNNRGKLKYNIENVKN